MRRHGPAAHLATPWAAALLAVVACTEQRPAKKPDAPAFAGWYRATLNDGDGLEVPFFISLPADPGKHEAVVTNGRQWTATEHRWSGKRVHVEFGVYATAIDATVDDTSTLVGKWTHKSRQWSGTSLAFRAERVEEPDPALKFEASQGPPKADFAGTWKLTTTDGRIAKLEVDHDGPAVVNATIWFADGVSEFVSGNVSGAQAQLSTFDGVAPSLLTLLRGDAGVKGMWITNPDLDKRVVFTGKRVETLDLPAPVKVSAADGRIGLPELEHPRYAGHPVIVQLVGSWCAHCRNAAPVMTKIHETLRPKGLQMLTIDYEFTSDSSYNLERAARLKKEYGITWQLITRDGSADEFWKIVPTGLSGPEPFAAFPMTFFIRPNGKVHAYHAGFVGVESKEAHAQLVARFERWAGELLQ